eukprot:416733-Rhodomonas_salina.3
MPQLVTTIGTWYKSADRVLDVYRFQDRSPQLWLATPGYPGNTVHRTKKFVKLLSRPDTAPFVREFSPLGSPYTFCWRDWVARQWDPTHQWLSK